MNSPKDETKSWYFALRDSRLKYIKSLTDRVNEDNVTKKDLLQE
jgi:hypothetical protein